MRALSYLCLFIYLISGCANVPAVHLPSTNDSAANVQPQTAPPVETPPPVKPVMDGIIFGKGDFRGVLEVEYVKLMIADELNPEKSYELFFGDRTGESETLVRPLYFFMELPAGKYRITSISIPVGTTLATEKTDILFTVNKGSLIYLGTLRVTGTDQRIRFGAVPVIRPGFDYKVEILNELDEALREFHARYPAVSRTIEVNLMKNLRIQAF